MKPALLPQPLPNFLFTLDIVKSVKPVFKSKQASKQAKIPCL